MTQKKETNNNGFVIHKGRSVDASRISNSLDTTLYTCDVINFLRLCFIVIERDITTNISTTRRDTNVQSLDDRRRTWSKLHQKHKANTQ
jgi:hypothetical protein